MSYLREFVALADSLNFTETARRFYLTQSALSKHMGALEKELDAKLIARTGSGIVLTDIGSAFREDAEAILNDYRKAVERIDALKHHREALIRIGCLRDAALPLLAPLSEWIKRHRPDIELQFLSFEFQKLPEMLCSHRVDVIVTMDADKKLRERCRAIHLYPDTYAVALSERHPLAKRTSVTLNALRDETLLVPSGEIWPEIRSFVEKRCPDEMKRNFRQIEDVDTLFFLIGSGQGAAIVASHNRFVYGSTIAFRPLDEPDLPEFPVSALWLKDQPSPESEKALELLVPAFEHAKAQIEMQPKENAQHQV